MLPDTLANRGALADAYHLIKSHGIGEELLIARVSLHGSLAGSSARFERVKGKWVCESIGVGVPGPADPEIVAGSKDTMRSLAYLNAQ